MNELVSERVLLPKSWLLPEVFRRRMGEDVGRQRLMREEGQHLVVLHQIPKAEDKGRREGAFFWIDNEGNWKSAPESGGRSALRAHVESYAARARHLDELLEITNSADEVHEVIDQAAPVQRAARNMAEVLQDLRVALPDDGKVLAIRDMAIGVERSMDLLVQDAKSSLDYLIAKSAGEQAKAAASATEEARKLNRLAAFFFPLVTLAAVFGINRPSEVISYGGLVFLCVGGLAMGAVVWALLKR